MKTCKKKFKIYNFITWFFSKAPSNSSNSSFKLASISIKSTKLEGSLQRILGLFKPNFVDKDQFVQNFWL